MAGDAAARLPPGVLSAADAGFTGAWRPGDGSPGRPALYTNRFVDAASGAQPWVVLRAFAHCQMMAAARLVLPSALCDIMGVDMSDDGFVDVYRRFTLGTGLQRVVLPLENDARQAGQITNMGETGAALLSWNPPYSFGGKGRN